LTALIKNLFAKIKNIFVNTAESMFPSVRYLRLIASYLTEYKKNWANDYAHIKPERFRQVLESSSAQAAS
jgi:hypothetical protein